MTAAMLDGAQCKNCRFWKGAKFDRGQCRRHAPMPANQAILFLGESVIAIADILSRHYELEWPTDIEAEATETSNSTMFPRTYSDDWCGDWQPDA